MTESLVEYLYKKARDGRLKLVSFHTEKVVRAELYLAMINSEKITYYPSNRAQGYILENGINFKFEWIETEKLKRQIVEKKEWLERQGEVINE